MPKRTPVVNHRAYVTGAE